MPKPEREMSEKAIADVYDAIYDLQRGAGRLPNAD